MTSKSCLSLCVAFCAALYAMAGMEIPALVSSFYQQRIKDSESGVYEWVEQGLLFVQVRVPEAKGDDAEEMEGRILLAEHRELLKWLAAQAAERRQDPVLPPALSRIRAFVRAEDPLWEYDAEWDYRFDGPHFSRRGVGERICCAVCGKKDVLATMPAGFLRATDKAAWIRGLCAVVRDRYRRAGNRPFLWEIGALDMLELVLDEGQTLDKWVSELGDAGNAVYAEYRAMQKELRSYLDTSSTAAWMRAEKTRLETLPDKITFTLGPNLDKEPPETSYAVVTNPIDELTFEVKVTETEVRRRRHTLHKHVTRMAQDPRFEKLFLSGGALTNAPCARTAKGQAAEAAFFANGVQTVEERETLIREALRENPGDAGLWNLQARVMMGRKDPVGALIALRNALRLEPEHEFALTNLALVYRELGRGQLAVSVAMLARGLARDGWCLRELDKVLAE